MSECIQETMVTQSLIEDLSGEERPPEIYLDNLERYSYQRINKFPQEQST
jgi:hypothetical protein